MLIAKTSNYLIINKPANLLVHPLDKVKTDKPTLVDLILKDFPEIKKVGEVNRPGIVHRLDEETSGIMVIARNQTTYHDLISQFQQHQVKKTYLALVFGEIKEKKSVIAYSIGRSKNSSRFTTGRGKPALTRYEVDKECFDSKNKLALTLLKVSPETGRTNQIRVHFKKINHPLVGDTKYAPRFFLSKNSCPRLFLHAASLTFKNPASKEMMTYEAPLPAELSSYLNTLSC